MLLFSKSVDHFLMAQPHVLLVTFPAQGHINPSLQFAKRLIKLGIEVTFATSVFAQRRMAKTATTSTSTKGLKFAAFSDGYDDGFKANVDDSKRYMTEIRNRGSQTIRNIILKSSDEGRPVTSLVYTLLLPWVEEVGRELHIPSALLWIQPATVLNIYYYYFNGYEDEMKCSTNNDPNWCIQLPRLPLLKSQDLPSFLVSSSSKDNGKYSFALPTFKEQLDTLDGEENPKVLVNTFDALEQEALKAIEKYNLIGIGPLIPSSFLDGKDPLDSSFGGDLFQKCNDYMEWLNSKPKSSIVYISFGSLLNLSRNQKEEIAKGLIEIKRPFLWVIRDQENVKEEEEEKLSSMMELEKQGKIVSWCSQLEVLTHPSLGCFVSHCGWNSTLESLSSGVPVVAFPHWTDQGTNAKLIEDVWKTGVRLRVNEDDVVDSEEIKRCIEIVMDGGEKGEEMRENAQKWKELAREAVKEGGSSEVNLKAFVQQVGKGC